MAKFTSKDVARLAGVSQSTVSYVMSGTRPISDATRKRVLDAIEALTYQPNAGARALASQRTRVIGLMVVPVHGPGLDGVPDAGALPFIETIASTAREHDHDVLLVTADEGSAGLRRLAGRSLCDAIVLMDIEAKDERVPVAASLPVPVILIGVPEDPATGSACVGLGGYLAARDSRTDGTLRWIVEQGFEMGRPSILEVEADKKAGKITGVRVGGRTVMVCEGTFAL